MVQTIDYKRELKSQITKFIGAQECATSLPLKGCDAQNYSFDCCIITGEE